MKPWIPWRTAVNIPPPFLFTCSCVSIQITAVRSRLSFSLADKLPPLYALAATPLQLLHNNFLQAILCAAVHEKRVTANATAEHSKIFGCRCAAESGGREWSGQSLVIEGENFGMFRNKLCAMVARMMMRQCRNGAARDATVTRRLRNLNFLNVTMSECS